MLQKTIRIVTGIIAAALFAAVPPVAAQAQVEVSFYFAVAVGGAFKEVGPEPNKAPANWTEMQEYAAKLTKRDASGRVTQWGVQIPSSGFPYWLFQGLAIEAGANLMNATGTETYYDKPEVIQAL